MVFFCLSLSILKFFMKMSLEYSCHILTTHLAPGLNTSLNILKTGILVENIHSKLNIRYFLFETKNWILISFPQYFQGQREDGRG